MTEEFKRDTSDNYLFPEIQVDDISKLTKPETVWYSDFDLPAYQIAANLERKYIVATLKSDPSFTIECKGIEVFKGTGKNISDTSELGVLNTKRAVEGLPELSVEDFEIKQHQALLMDEDKAFETAKIQVWKKLKEYRQQYRLPYIVPLLGEGRCFREDLPTVRQYKGNRVDTLRPLLLKKIRKWLVDEVNAVMTVDTKDGGLIECDDKLEMYASQGYNHYRKHGWFNIGVISSDKDAMNSAKLLINPDTYSGENNPKRGKLKFPKPMLIEATDRSVGNLELISKSAGKDKTTREVKGYGFKFLLFQCALGFDSADNYNALGHLGGMNFGVKRAYEVLSPCETPQEALQATIDVYADKLPYGVQYTAHNGTEMDVDTMTYMDTYFRVAYMLRSLNDSMDFYKLCDIFKVDTSKIVDNNLLTPPIRTYVGDENHVKEVQEILTTIIKEDMKGIKSMKKADQAVQIDIIKEKLLSISFDSHYEMIQYEKEFNNQEELS